MKAFLVFFQLFLAAGATAADPTLVYGNISIEAPISLQSRIKGWIDNAEASKTGAELLREIRSSRNRLHIQHIPYAVQSAGKTLVPLTKNIDNGVGVSVVLAMNFEMPEAGSHIVLECEGGRTSFTALMNFIHELRHARDAMTGNFIGHRFEKDAVESENNYRRDLGISESRCLRADEDHIWQIWFPG